MRFRSSLVVLILGVAAASVAGCATSDQWSEWREHSSQFASGRHMGFSLRHQGANPRPHVTEGDVERARFESWWGDPVVVSPDQLFAG
jgi:hypothetical protein